MSKHTAWSSYLLDGEATGDWQPIDRATIFDPDLAAVLGLPKAQVVWMPGTYGADQPLEYSPSTTPGLIFIRLAHPNTLTS